MTSFHRPHKPNVVYTLILLFNHSKIFKISSLIFCFINLEITLKILQSRFHISKKIALNALSLLDLSF